MCNDGRVIAVVDGFKQLRAARDLGWPKFEVRRAAPAQRGADRDPASLRVDSTDRPARARGRAGRRDA